ncbi:MAG: flagellar hook protein FlgE [Myxococcales bacterium]|nr:flagellar hook protein FlgE [Myxococcales bacterium]MCB9536346.1 flagellar hook protein FlgE [Myxococcales bacterium]
MAGLLGSLYTGNTGLHAASIGVGVVGDNIANSNTTGFKGARAHFEDLISEFITGGSGTNQVGRGVTLERIEKLFTQGSFQNTGVPTDLAISGDGFFVVRGQEGTENQYTRNGAFRFDEEGFLINQSGQRVQGYNANGVGELSAVQDDVRITRRQLEPRATEQVEMHANLRPDDPIQAFDPADPEGTSSFRTSVVLYDSLGNPHEMTVYGTHTAQGTWELNGTVDGAEIAGGVAGTPVQVPLGTLDFDADGLLVAENVPDPVVVDWIGATQGQITFDFGDALNDGGTGRAGSSQWNQVRESSANFITQDGYGTGELDNIAVDQHGTVTGGFTNGRTLVLGQVATARFEDPTSLGAVGGNNFVETASSGQAVVGSALTGGRGGVVSGALELSNVEISDQFIDLIAYQRAFQANSRTIQTADGLLQEVFQLLR